MIIDVTLIRAVPPVLKSAGLIKKETVFFGLSFTSVLFPLPNSLPQTNTD